MDSQTFIRHMPKVELHLHLEGTLAPERLLALARRNRIDIGTNRIERIRAAYRYRNFDDFVRILMLGVRVMRKPEDFYDIAMAMATNLLRQNVRYAEVYWTPQLYRHLPYSYDELFGAISAAAMDISQDGPLKINWIPDIVRNRAQYAREVMDWATSDRARQGGVVALGLGGPEREILSGPLVEVFHEARARGLPANPHAGEGTSAEHVRETISLLQPARIGHGISAVEDADLVRYIVDNGITLEICPTSNLRLGICSHYADHPLAALARAGCHVTINSDDPALFDTDLTREYLHAVRDCGLNLKQLQASVLNAIDASYLEPADRLKLTRTFEQEFCSLEAGTVPTAQHLVLAEPLPGLAGRDNDGLPSATSLIQEQEEQGRWQLISPEIYQDLFDELVVNEFRDPQVIRSRYNRLLSRLIRYVYHRVPYYRELLSEHGLKAQDIRSVRDLVKLPVLDKQVVRTNAKALLSTRLPPQEKIFGMLSSSGTTGRPVRIYSSVRQNNMFHIQNQRNYRWYRLDPLAKLAFFRLDSQLPRLDGQKTNPDGETVVLPSWRYVGSLFRTGAWYGYNITNPVEDQLRWLEEYQPDYLGTYAESLEHLAFAGDGSNAFDSIRDTISISEQLTASMRRRIVDTLKAPVHQGYGLSETGMIATECDFGRFHVHVEHCIVEIVDLEGNPCRPGETGRILVTILNNLVMPLIRYDTDDLAEVVAGPCACGRTLPSFGSITGRYSRIAFLPEGTLACAGAIRHCIDTMPAQYALRFRQYQLHQFRDNRFELRLVSTGELPPAFMEAIHAAWAAAAGDAELSIGYVEHIPRTAGGKHQDFTSDYFPDPDADEGD